MTPTEFYISQLHLNGAVGTSMFLWSGVELHWNLISKMYASCYFSSVSANRTIRQGEVKQKKLRCGSVIRSTSSCSVISKNLPLAKADGQQITMLELSVNESWPPFKPLETTLAKERLRRGHHWFFVGCIFVGIYLYTGWTKSWKVSTHTLGLIAPPCFTFEGCCFADGILYLLVRGFRRQNLKIRIF